MTGRRDQRKQATFESIVAVASELFHRDGYDEATIEMIADGAGVSPGTVYNYFGTKSAVLMAAVTFDTDHALVEASRALDPAAGSAFEAMAPVVGVYLDLMTSLGRETLGQLLAQGFASAQSPMFAELVTLDERILSQLVTIFGDLRDRGLVRPDVDPAAAATLVYSIVAVAIMIYLAYPEQSRAELAEGVRGQLALVFEGIAAGSD
jgi:AcrR family transcriptional regulator